MLVGVPEGTSKQWKVLRKAWRDVRRNANEENVHNLRVAARRIVSSLSLLDSILLSSHRLKARSKIKRLMKRLGPLRDVQVQMSISQSWPRTKAPAAFHKYLKRKSAAYIRAIQAYLTDKRRRAIRRALKSAERNAERGVQDLNPSLFRARLATALDTQRDQFKTAKTDAKSKDPQKIHRLRVAAKRLRYSIEAVSPGLAEKPNAELRSLRRYQKDLGQKRDLTILQKTLHDWRQRTRSVSA